MELSRHAAQGPGKARGRAVRDLEGNAGCHERAAKNRRETGEERETFSDESGGAALKDGFEMYLHSRRALLPGGRWATIGILSSV